MPDVAGRVADEFEARVREHEEGWLSPLGVRSYETRGRAREEEEECRLRTPFQRDRDRIVHSKAFRRLKHKTQVFIDPKSDHYRTRLTHTLETAGISRTVARALRLNEDLTEAIALGHDLGHPPFGHTGEEVLDEILYERFGKRFRHNEQSVRVVELLERDGRGLNLTAETCDGILHHTGPAELPQADIACLGDRGSRRIDALVHDLVEASAAAGDIVQSDEIGRAMLNLRAFMFERVYLGPEAADQRRTATGTIERIVAQLVEHPGDLPEDRPGGLPERITDYVAGMTDRFALAWR